MLDNVKPRALARHVDERFGGRLGSAREQSSTRPSPARSRTTTFTSSPSIRGSGSYEPASSASRSRFSSAAGSHRPRSSASTAMRSRPLRGRSSGTGGRSSSAPGLSATPAGALTGSASSPRRRRATGSALHWEWACDRLTARQAHALNRNHPAHAAGRQYGSIGRRPARVTRSATTRSARRPTYRRARIRTYARLRSARSQEVARHRSRARGRSRRPWIIRQLCAAQAGVRSWVEGDRGARRRVLTARAVRNL